MSDPTDDPSTSGRKVKVINMVIKCQPVDSQKTGVAIARALHDYAADRPPPRIDPTIHWPEEHVVDRDLPTWGWRSSCMFAAWLAACSALGATSTWLLLRRWSRG